VSREACLTPSYILNRGWIDKSEKHVPTFDEIVGRARGRDERSR
jgi:protein KRI1